MALSDVERQRRRRAKLKKEAEEARFDPKKFIAFAVEGLHKQGVISDEMLHIIIKEAVSYGKYAFDDFDQIKEMYLLNQIESFFNLKGEN